MIPVLDRKPVASADHRLTSPAASTPAGGRFCLSCNQSLQGVTLGLCPECGREFNHADPTTTSPWPYSPAVHGAAAFVRASNLVWAVVFGVAFVLCFSVIADAFIFQALSVWLIPIGLVTMLPALRPRAPLSCRSRLWALACPIVVLVTIWTYWPFFINFSIHRHWFAKAADAVSRSGPRESGWIGIIHHRRALEYEGSVGFQLTGDDASGTYVVRDDPARPFIWSNTNWEVPLGGDWHLVWED